MRGQVTEYKIGVRIGHGTRPIIGVIVRANDYYYIDHRSAGGLAEIAGKFGISSVEWFNVVNDLSHLIESGADLKPLGDVAMESPWQEIDAKAGAAVGAYFKLLNADLRVSLEGERDSANYVIATKDFASRGTIAVGDVGPTITHIERWKSLIEASATAMPPVGIGTGAAEQPSIAMIDAIDSVLRGVQASPQYGDVQPLDCLAAALSSLLGYDSWLKHSSVAEARMLS